MIETRFSFNDTVWKIQQVRTPDSYKWDVTSREKVTSVNVQINSSGTTITYQLSESGGVTEATLTDAFRTATEAYDECEKRNAAIPEKKKIAELFRSGMEKVKKKAEKGDNGIDWGPPVNWNQTWAAGAGAPVPNEAVNPVEMLGEVLGGLPEELAKYIQPMGDGNDEPDGEVEQNLDEGDVMFDGADDDKDPWGGHDYEYDVEEDNN